MSDLVSQFNVSSLYTQINYNDSIIRVTPLEYADEIKWFTNRKDGITGYIIVNSVTGESELVRLNKGMKYSTSALFNENLNRKLRFEYPTTNFGKISFEIDNEGKPYYIIPTIKYTAVGLKAKVTGVIIFDPITGESKRYSNKKIPTWVDIAHSASLIIEQVDDWGTYKNGFWNSIFGQKNVVNTTTGYNYLAMNDDIYLYTGITSVVSDESNLGFILTNMRTSKTTYYSVPGAEEYIIESFKWLGIPFDEGVSFGGNHGPYRQSERRDIYKKYVKVLLDADKAYIAFDTPEELDAKRNEIANFQYDASTRMQMRNSLTLSKEEVDALIAEGKQYVVRFKIEPNEDVHVNDLIRGDVVINSSILDDKVLYKSADELPTYHLANIVDDHLMEVSHVIRGEEWLPSAPLHVLLYRAFGWADTMPQFAHLPLLLKPEGNGKLSKRDGDRLGFPVFPLEWHDPKTGDVSSGYRESGYLPEAVINFLALLGWNPGNDQELMSMDELIRLFDLGRCSKAGAKFDYKKGIWFNHEYILQKSDAELAELFKPVLTQQGVDVAKYSDAYLTTVVSLVKGRVNFVKELWEQARFFFEAPTTYAEKDVKKRWKEDTPAILTELIAILQGMDNFESKPSEEVVIGWITEKGYHMGNVMNAFRLAVVGECKGPHMFDITELLGKEETIARIEKAIKNI